MRSSALRRAAVATVASRGLSAFGLLAVTPFLSRQLGVESYGVLVTLTGAAALIAVADLGIANGVVSRIASVGWECVETQKLLSAARVCLGVATIVAVLVSVVVAWSLPWPAWLNAPSVPDGELRLATFVALLGVSLSLTTGLGQKLDLARQRGHLSATWNGAAATIGPICALVAAMVGANLVAAVAALSVSRPLVLAIQTRLSIRSLPVNLRPGINHVDRDHVVALLKSGGAFFGLGVLATASFQLDGLVVSGMLGASAAAQFAVVLRSFNLFGSTVQASLSQLWSAFAEALHVGDVEWVRKALWKYTVGAGLVVLVPSIPIVIFGEQLVQIWLGEGSEPSLLLLLSAAAWCAYAAAVHPLSMFLNGAGLERPQLLVAIPMTVANVALSIALARAIGVAGPLLGSLIAHVVLVLIPMILLARRRLQDAERRSA